MKRIIPCVLITLALIFAGSFLPVLGFTGLMLCPLPLCILGCLDGHRNMSIAELMIEATLFLAFSPTMAAYFLIGCAPLSAVIFSLSRENFRDAKKFTGGESLLICMGADIAFKLIMIALFWVFTGRNIMFPDAAQVSEVMAELYGEQPELREAVRQVLSLIPHLMPSMLVIYATAESFLNYHMCRAVMQRYFPQSKNIPPELPPFRLWKFPVSLLLVSVAGFILGWFIDADEFREVTLFVMNLQITANILMFVQGVSMAFWIMDGFRLRRGAKIAVCFVLSVPFFWPWLIVIGMCEMSINLREKIKFGAK